MEFVGYCPNQKLPFGPGAMVIIPKGTTFTSTHPQKHSGVTKKTMKIRVNHILPGCEIPESEKEYRRNHGRNVDDLKTKEVERKYPWGILKETVYVVSNPEVRWAGTGGYWFGVDINAVKPVESV